jgi:3-dehydroquinate synthase
MKIINVKISEHKYDVYIGRDFPGHIAKLLSSLSQEQKIIIITDDFFEKTYAKLVQTSLNDRGFDCSIHVMSGGKSNKSFSEVLRIYGKLEISNFARDSVLIALGGGVVGDLAGFVASTWYRGMVFVHVPTTLMAMIDSSIGGKVAINYRDTINAVGNYYHPIANFMDLNLIDSLSERDYVSGLAEVIKCALIADNDFVDYLLKHKEQILKRSQEHLVYSMQRTIEIKVDHVHNDVREGGKRLLLNYGHTLGHAIEMATHTKNSESFRHGEGVALGMVAAASVAQSHLSTPVEIGQQIRDILKEYKLPTFFSASELGFKRDELIESCARLILKDKKRKDNQLRFILVNQLGKANVFTGISKEHIIQAYQEIIKE